MSTSRRRVLATLPLAAGAFMLRPKGLFSAHGAAVPTIQEVIDRLLAQIPGEPLEDTVDTVKIGDPSQPVTGVATTFLATSDVIGRAVDRGCNLIITHEPTFYNHLDDTNWLDSDPIYNTKRDFLTAKGVVVWRFHDHLHKHEPDGVIAGILEKIGWEPVPPTDQDAIFEIETTSLDELASFFKKRLDIKTLRIVGKPEMTCSRVALLPGAYGGRDQMALLRRDDVEVLVCGEVREWETSEYVRDAVSSGRSKGLIVLGHAKSEEPGMEWLAERLRLLLPEVAVFHIPAGNPFHFV